MFIHYCRILVFGLMTQILLSGPSKICDEAFILLCLCKAHMDLEDLCFGNL